MAFKVTAIVSAVSLAALYQSMLGCCVVTHVFRLSRIVTHSKLTVLLLQTSSIHTMNTAQKRIK